MNFKTKKELNKELEETKAELLHYKNKVSMIEYKLRNQKEKDSNIFTLLRDIRNIIY